MLGDTKLFVFKSLLTAPSNVLPLHLEQIFQPIIWIFTEGDWIKSRLPFKIIYYDWNFPPSNSTLHFQSYYQIWVDAMELNLLMIVVLLQTFVEKVKEIVTMTLTVLEPWNVAATIVSVLFLLILTVAMTLINKIEYSISTNYWYILYRVIRIQIVKKYWDLEICRKS